MLKQPRITCELVPVTQLGAAAVAGWRELSRHALEKNAYLSPDFVLPSLRMREEAGAPPPLALIARVRGDATPVGLGLFRPAGPRATFPLPHLQAYRSAHSYRTGLLLREDAAPEAAGCMVDRLARERWRWQGVRFSRMLMSGPQADLLAATRRGLGVEWHEVRVWQRAALDLRPERIDAWRAHISRNRRKDVRRCMRKLEEQGRVTWRFVEDGAVGTPQIEAFLALEHRAWEAGDKTSLRSERTHEWFFRSMVGAFAHHAGVFFTELCLDGRVIASTCNLRVGDQGFAFKVAYDPEYRRLGPGILNEHAFLEALGDRRRMAWVDSGSEEGSFIEQLWPERMPLGTGHLVAGKLARGAASMVTGLRETRRLVLASVGA